MSESPLSRFRAPSWNRDTLIKTLKQLRTPGAIAIFASLALHGLVLGGAPWRTNSSEDQKREVKMVELSPAEQSRLPVVTAPVTTLPPSYVPPNLNSLPTSKLPPMGSPYSAGSTTDFNSDWLNKYRTRLGTGAEDDFGTSRGVDVPKTPKTPKEPEEQKTRQQSNTQSNTASKASTQENESNRSEPNRDREQKSGGNADNLRNSGPNVQKLSPIQVAEQQIDNQLKEGVVGTSGEEASKRFSSWITEVAKSSDVSDPGLLLTKPYWVAPKDISISCSQKDCSGKEAAFVVAIDAKGELINSVGFLKRTGDSTLDEAAKVAFRKFFEDEIKPQDGVRVYQVRIQFEEQANS